MLLNVKFPLSFFFKVVKHKIPLLKRQGIHKEPEQSNSAEEKDIYKEIRRKYKQKHKLKPSFSESKKKKSANIYQEFRIQNFKKDFEREEEEFQGLASLQESATEIKQEPQETAYRPTPSFKENSPTVEYANKPTLAKKPKYAYHPPTLQETVKRGRQFVKFHK